MVRYTYQTKVVDPESPLFGKFYFGKHSSVDGRELYFGSGNIIRQYIRDHSWDGLEVTILDYYDTDEELCRAERELIERKMLELGDRCLNLRASASGGWRDVSRINMSRLSRVERVQQCRRAARSKLSATPERRALWSRHASLAHSRMSPHRERQRYDKVAAGLRDYYSSESWQKEKSMRVARNRESNIRRAAIWRGGFRSLFGCTPESFRMAGRMKDAIALYKIIKDSTREEQQYEVERFMESV